MPEQLLIGDKCPIFNVTGIFVQQSDILRALSHLSNPADPARRNRFLAALKADQARPRAQQDYLKILVDYGVVTGSDDEQHLRLHWFPPDRRSPWFPLEPDLERSIADSTIEAFEEARTTRLPLEYYWVIPVLDQTYQFPIKVIHRKSAHQITVLRFTPMPNKG